MFKMRELRGAGLVRVTLIPTDENEADIFTKPLDRAPFERHRDKIMNRASGYGVAKGAVTVRCAPDYGAGGVLSACPARFDSR